MFAALLKAARQQVVGRHQARVVAHQLLQQVDCVKRAALRGQAARQAETRPTQRPRGDQLAVDGFGLLVFLQRGVQLGAQVREVGGVARLRVGGVDAGADRRLRIAWATCW